MTGFNNFPLATGLADLVEPLVANLISGLPSELLEHVTPTTAELLIFWFQQDYCDGRELNFHEGQRSAILRIIYAHEVLRCSSLRELYDRAAPEAMSTTEIFGEVSRTRNSHPKYAAKMATGTGKTWVVNALLIWQYMNHMASPTDDRFTSNFLLVAPGLIVYDRLLDSFRGSLQKGVRDFSSSDIFSQRELFVPENFRSQIFGFLQSSIVVKSELGQKVTSSGMLAITNWHLLSGHEDPDVIDWDEGAPLPGEAVDAKAAVDSFFPLTPGASAGNSLESLNHRFQRGAALQALTDLPDLLVFNDEAHHIHEVKKDEEITDVEWQKSLFEIASTKGHRFVQIDFSATPYNELGSGSRKARRYFPHIVLDFDLRSAMSRGLVKALALDRRKEVASLPLDFRAERDEQRRVVGLSNGQRVMLSAGLKKLQILEGQFATTDSPKHPKLMVICEDTAVTPHVVDYLKAAGLEENDVLRVDSGRKQELGLKDWEPVRERLFNIDAHRRPRVIVSVLMLREGFDVNNICVIVPLRSSEASILLEQTIGRGLRLMWRGNEAINELKRDTRDRIAHGQEPTNYFDVLFVVEHPAFSQFYEDLLGGEFIAEVGDDGDSIPATGDLESVGLRVGYQAYDFEVPVILRDAEDELMVPTIDPMTLPRSKYELGWLLRQIRPGERFISQDVQTGTQYGDYRVDGGVLTATGYNDYLSRMTTRISEALGRALTGSASKYREIGQFPVLQSYKPLLTGWLDSYVRNRLFGMKFDPSENEQWRVLLLEDVIHQIAGVFATKLTELQASQVAGEAEVYYRLTSEVETLPVRSTSCVEVEKCIYPKLPVPTKSGGLERLFIEWLEQDGRVEALLKIHEYRHDFLRRPYLKSDGMPAEYSPDFLVRTDTDVYVVETKAQSALSDENVERKKRAASSWCSQINALSSGQRNDLEWHYVLLGEAIVHEWKSGNSRATDLLDLYKSTADEGPGQGTLL